MRECLQDRRQQWFVHLKAMQQSAYITSKVGGGITGEQPIATWNEVIRSDPEKSKVSNKIPKDKNFWKSFIRNRAIQGSQH